MKTTVETIEKDRQVSVVFQNIDKSKTEIEVLEVTSDEIEKTGINQGSQIKKYLDELDELEEKHFGEMKAAIKAGQEYLRPRRTLAKALLDILRKKLGAYQTQKREAARLAQIEAAEKQRKAEAKAAAKGKPAPIVAPPPVLAPAATVNTGEAKATYRKVKKWRVIDENKIPGKYWILDETQIGKEIRAGATIEGIEGYEEDAPSFG